MYVTDYQKERISLAQTIDRIFFEPGNARRCHKWVYRHYGRYMLGVSYDTYLSYLHRPAQATLPEHIVELFVAAKARLNEPGRTFGRGKMTTGCETRSGAHGGSIGCRIGISPDSRHTGSDGSEATASEHPAGAIETMREKAPAEQD